MLDAMLTFPDKGFATLRNFTQETGLEDFKFLISGYVQRLADSGVLQVGARPMLRMGQRRFKLYKPYAHDGVLEFDLRTINGQEKSGKEPALKAQPEWLEFAYKLICNKGSNIQFQIGCWFEYDKCLALEESQASLRLIKDALLATTSLLSKIVSSEAHRFRHKTVQNHGVS